MVTTIFYTLCLLILTQVKAELQTVNGRIKITVGTTAGCINTMDFIGNHLAEAYGLYGSHLDVEFIPWGRTVWDENGMTCQFGTNDCWANRVHRCVLNLLKGNQDAQVKYMICEFTSPYPAYVEGTYFCVDAIGVSVIEVDHCVANPLDDLDRDAQLSAVAPMSIINLVPSIVFNDDIDVDLHTLGRRRLTSEVCFALAADPTTGVNSCQI